MPQATQPVLEDTLITFKVTSANNIGLTVFNNAFFGNNLASRRPSFEYPIGSAEEHMVRGGPWIGGIKPRLEEDDVYDTLVTTATIDGFFGSFDTEGVSEFFPTQTELTERSILPNSRYFDPDAKSEQDIFATYFDRHARAGQFHRPLNIKVEQEILQFSFEPFDAIILVNFNIINMDQVRPIFDMYMGFYAELASGWKDGHTEWPPSGWFQNKDIVYFHADTLRLLTEHHFLLDDGNAPSWAGVQLLGIRGPTAQDTISTKTVSFNWWNWDPGGNEPGTPVNDVERYETLSNGSIDATGSVEAPNNDPVAILSVGPLGFGAGQWPDGTDRFIMNPGDTVTVSYALIGGQPVPHAGRTARDDILLHAQWAQTAFDLNFDIPVPPPSPLLKIIPERGSISLRWDDLAEEFIDPKSRMMDFEGYRIYVSQSKEQSEFRLLREFDIVDSLFYDTGLGEIDDPIVIDGDSLAYRHDVTQVRDGFKYWVAVTSFDTGTPDVESLESGIAQNRKMVIPGAGVSTAETGLGKVKVFPNPYRCDSAWDGRDSRDRYLWFVNLPERCTIRITTLSGDLVDTIEFDGSTYDAREIRGIYDPTDPFDPDRDLPVLSGRMAAWDIISENDQAIATGLYLFSVKDRDTGEVHVGKFMVLK
jgi:hypothetical protein